MSNVISISERVRPAPKPETMHAILECEKCSRVRGHDFVQSIELKSKAITKRTFDLKFKCQVCDTTRIWGNIVQDLR